MRNHRFLITGGAGFIGSHFVRLLVDHHVPKERLVVLDKLTYAGDIKRLGDCDASTHYFYKGDIGDAALIDDILKTHQITCVVNFAAESHVDRSIEEQQSFMQTNYFGVQNLLDRTLKFWQSRACLEEALFMQISTDEVYGSSAISGGLLFDEASPLKPMNPYAATKAAADLLVGAYQNTYNYPAMIVRSTNNYGPGQNSEKFIPKIIQCLKNNRDIPVYGQGEQMRTWVHVKDNCYRICQLIRHGRVGEIYNVVGEAVITNIDLAKKLVSLYTEAGKAYSGKVTFVEDRLGHDAYYHVSDRKLIDALGAYEQVFFEAALKELLEGDDCGYKCKREARLVFTAWNDSLVTGVAFMDKEHKEIILRAEQLHELLLHGHMAAYQTGLMELLTDYIVRHLDHEEELQKMIGFHLLDQHRIHHEAFKKWAEDIHNQIKHAVLSKEELLIIDYEINEWFIDHILSEDMKVGDYHERMKV
ncbi:MAG: GDP-mannose 4,6-dehydratase [Clostridia bacterium]|nr:GDP-mannose 4,6-dehydratase [Clostridia bacterium]